MSKKQQRQKDQTRLAALPRVFSPEECARLIESFSPQLEPAWIETLDVEQSLRLRRSSAVFIKPSPDTEWVFKRLLRVARDINEQVYGFELDRIREGFQFTRYEVGEYYGPHFDIGPGKLTERKLSMTVQLSPPEDYTGGELTIYPDFVAPKDQGMITVFPSFMAHNVLPVKSGVRYSLVCWVAGPPFK